MLSDSETQRLESCLERRNNGEPVAYITGTRGFWDFEVEVNSSTLIPRPETEFLVETALGLFQGRNISGPRNRHRCDPHRNSEGTAVSKGLRD